MPKSFLEEFPAVGLEGLKRDDGGDDDDDEMT